MSNDTLSEYNFVQGRDVAALHDPRPTCLIGACTDEGEVCFATVIWVTPISHDPTMVVFALRAKSRTMEIIRETGCFSICIPPADEEGVRLIEFCGNNSGHQINKGDVVEHELVTVETDRNADNDDSVNTDNIADTNNNTTPGNDDTNTNNDAAQKTNDTSRTSKSTSRQVPIVNHSYSWETGVIENIQEAGDHLLAVGTITRAATYAPRDKHEQLTPYDSLLCVQHGTYAKAQTL